MANVCDNIYILITESNIFFYFPLYLTLSPNPPSPTARTIHFEIYHSLVCIYKHKQIPGARAYNNDIGFCKSTYLHLGGDEESGSCQMMGMELLLFFWYVYGRGNDVY